MKLGTKFRGFVLSWIMIVAFSGLASAATINISLDPDDWNRDTGYSQQSPGTLTQTAEGHLRATKTTATGGTGWALDVQSDEAFNFQGATLRFTWKYNSQNRYGGLYLGTISDGRTLVTELYTTYRSFDNSKLITSDKWYTSEISFIDSFYTITVTSEDGVEDHLCRTTPISAYYWEKLADAHFWFRIIDNYAAGAYFELAEATIQQPDPVPVPAAVWLLGSGLVGLAVFRMGSRKANL